VETCVRIIRGFSPGRVGSVRWRLDGKEIASDEGRRAEQQAMRGSACFVGAKRPRQHEDLLCAEFGSNHPGLGMTQSWLACCDLLS